MREIKFRAWDKISKKMKPHEEFIQIMPDVLINKSNQYEIMQYTGLKDMKGKKIYEGDILIDCDCYLSKVVYRDGCFEVVYKFHSFHLCDPRISFVEYKVIGNIYENPELLEVKQ